MIRQSAVVSIVKAEDRPEFIIGVPQLSARISAENGVQNGIKSDIQNANRPAFGTEGLAATDWGTLPNRLVKHVHDHVPPFSPDPLCR